MTGLIQASPACDAGRPRRRRSPTATAIVEPAVVETYRKIIRQDKYRKDPILFALLSVYELPTLSDYWVFERKRWTS